MKSGARWAIVDTETDGLHEPIHIVEISAQLMEGWNPVGETFRMLLNHNVHIPSEAVAIHGYTREYLNEHGRDPVQVHAAFLEYARDYPLVAHNLSYDWNRCLEPEWARLRVPQVGKRGFCSMMLARRLVHEVQSYRLDSLRECFRIEQGRSHQAKNDVLAVVDLFEKVYRPRLESVGLESWNEVSEFAKRTPVAKCMEMIRAKGSVAPEQTTESKPTPKRFLAPKSMEELIGLCRGLIADDRITTSETVYLSAWLQDVGFIKESPAAEIGEMLERILQDGVVSREEKEELKALLEQVAPIS